MKSGIRPGKANCVWKPGPFLEEGALATGRDAGLRFAVLANGWDDRVDDEKEQPFMTRCDLHGYDAITPKPPICIT
ncbi:MAG: hypothetical protein ABWY13_15110 [Mesorhizobium sp.]